ncbi:DUF3307 domain-containing protein [Erysipelothrix tonsillarum]|uniref:DUF3307 domain-containing protein n=1 Tax=Erysipelothrix tonsillarum TaxID=38402 RepID=UPI000375E980|nr:DUF3307 domain-containing protein [Erysipelothrix tonsillarum]
MVNLFLCFTILHILADFHLQPNKMFENKSSSFSWLAGHIGIHAIVFGIFAVMFDGDALIYVEAMVFVHFILELMKAILIQCELNIVRTHLGLVEGISQLIHLAILYGFAQSLFTSQYFTGITQMQTVFGFDATLFLSIVVGILLLTRPIQVWLRIKKGSLTFVNA